MPPVSGVVFLLQYPVANEVAPLLILILEKDLVDCSFQNPYDHEKNPGTPPGSRSLFAPLRGRPVHEVEVDLVQAEELGALVEGPQGVVEALIGVPDLRRDEEVIARDAAAPDGFAHAALVLVHRRGVDVSVAALEGAQRRIDGDVIGDLPDTEADLGDRPAVVHHEAGDRHGRSSQIGRAHV